jgi:2-polyprenyl-6-methoxyphenol hydroxylase-like FAD-dependent oxidoreductase
METVNIIGGGIGGLTLANALQNERIDFKLFEQSPQITEVGAAISISKAALDILQRLDLATDVKNTGYETRHFHISDKKLKDIRVTSTESPVTIIHRAKLIDILVSRLPKEKIQLNTKLTTIRNETEFSELNFSNGLKLKSRCTAIADGIQSISRKQIFPGIKIRHSGQAIWRGITTLNLPEQYCHTYTEIWSNTKRFLFVPMDSTTIFWLAIKNAAIGGEDDPDTIRQELVQEYHDFHPFVKELLLNSSNFIRNDLADLGTEKRKWYQDKIVFIGDAIHATTPNLAQGGCQAIEDAYCLSLLMKKSNYDFSEVFPTFQSMREKKVSFIVNTSWRFGKMAQYPISSRLAKYFFKYVPNSTIINLERKLNDLSYISSVRSGVVPPASTT